MAATCKLVNGNSQESKEEYWTPFLRQLHISSGTWTVLFMTGLCTGAPTVFIPQLRREADPNMVIDDELASWLYSLSNFTAIPWLFILPSFTQRIGMKIPYLTACLIVAIVFLVLYFSSEPYQLIIAQVMQGYVNAYNISIIVYFISEYSSPKYRTMFICIQVTSFFWGIWVANTIGSYLNWRYIPIMGVVCFLYSFTVAFYPESPHWLASRGKFKECEVAYRWYRGFSRESEMELQDTIKYQQDNQADRNRLKMMSFWTRFMETVKCKQFYFPLLLSILAGAQYNLTGKFVCTVYALDIIKKITSSEAAYSIMLILDGVTVTGMYIGSFLMRIVKLRLLYFSLSFVSITVMFILSLYLYLIKLGIIQENHIVSLLLLVAYSLSISCGPLTLSMAIYSEIISVKYQTVSRVVSSFTFVGLCTGMLKFSPMIFKGLGMHGSFMFYAVSTGICTVLLYMYLPETKDKTFLEIEECFKNIETVPSEADRLTR